MKVDEANAIFIDAEKKLAPIRKLVSVPMGPETQLAWSGRKQRWRLVVRDGTDVIEVLQSSREERLEAVGFVNELLKKAAVI